jgi:hypothetical protein
LHHEVKGSSLYQADSGKALGSTFIERKQMSTKTTLKRIALVAVSALGFGVLATVPSNAANTSTSAFTKTVTSSFSYLTVASNTTGATPGDTTTAGGFFWLDVANESTAAHNVGLVPDYETMTVSVFAAPLATASSAVGALTDLAIRPVKMETTAAGFAFVPVNTDSPTTTSFVLSSGKITTYEALDNNPVTPALGGKAARYAFAVAPISTTSAAGKGYYTIRVRTQTADSRTIDNLIYVKFVNGIADADARISVTGSGTLFQGETLTFQTARSYSAALTGTNSDRIQMGKSIATNSTAILVKDVAPALTAKLVASAGTDVSGTNLQASDTGVGAVDHVAPTTASPTTNTVAQTALSASYRNIANGTYGITSTAVLPTLTDLATNKIQVNLTGASARGELTVTTGAARTSTTSASVKITGTGVAAANTVLTSAITAANPTAAQAYSLPLSNKSVTLTVDIPTAGHNLTTVTTWSGNYASADVTPATTTSSTTATNADGEITRVITNSSPLAGAVATVKITGFADPDNSITVTLTWAAAVVSSITVVEPVSGIHTALKGTTNFTVVAKDQFGNPMANEVIQPIVGGSAGVGNYSATKTYSTVTTNASGLATWSLTDATAVADDTDSITFKSISNASTSSDAYTITYKTTVAAVASFLKFYTQQMNATSNTSINLSIPTTVITAANKLSLVYGVNLSDGTLDDLTDGATDAAVKVRLRALTSAGLSATGASVTVTAGDGGHVVGLDGNPASTRTFAVASPGDVYAQVFATKPGLIKFTVTSGTVTDSFTLDVAAQTGTAVRSIAISGGSTGTANGDGVPMTVTVKDRYGNAVGSVLLTVAASGVGSFVGGGTTQSFTTDASGTYTFLASSMVSAGGSGTFSASIATAGSDANSSAGYYGTTEVDSTLAAGKATVSQAVTFTAGKNTSTVAAEAATAAAEAASDAAAEAIDAANAATDAANLAAEAADAATVAAEEARDAADAATAAVEELATQVATLMAALKAQITTLANTVAKIAKKVKA